MTLSFSFPQWKEWGHPASPDLARYKLRNLKTPGFKKSPALLTKYHITIVRKKMSAWAKAHNQPDFHNPGLKAGVNLKPTQNGL
jgi:hypothetical protein